MNEQNVQNGQIEAGVFESRGPDQDDGPENESEYKIV